MAKTYFEKVYRKSWMHRSIPVSVLFIVVIILLGISVMNYNNNANNPFVVNTNRDYEKAAENNNYVKITTDKIYDLGIILTETRKKFGVEIGKDTEAKFVGISLGKNILAISLSTDQYDEIMKQKTGQYILTGKLTGFKNKDLKLFRKFLVTSKVSLKEVTKLLYTNYLDYQTPFDSIFVYIVITVIVFAIAMFVLICYVRSNKFAIKRLKNYSNGNLEEAYQKIDSEIQSYGVFKEGPVTITPNYIIVDSLHITFAMPFNELMWAYKSITQHKTYGVPSGKSFSLVLAFSDKSVYTIALSKSEEKIDMVLQYILEHNEKVFVGYSREIENMIRRNFSNFTYQWNNHKNDFKA